MRIKEIQLPLTEEEFRILEHILASSDLAMTYSEELTELKTKIETIASRLAVAKKLMERFTGER